MVLLTFPVVDYRITALCRSEMVTIKARRRVVSFSNLVKSWGTFKNPTWDQTFACTKMIACVPLF
jgi:hypothetical protein